MAKMRIKVIKFGPQNKGNIIGKVKHTRTGYACQLSAQRQDV